jgi:hypothetical protein
LHNRTPRWPWPAAKTDKLAEPVTPGVGLQVVRGAVDVPADLDEHGYEEGLG